MRSAACPTQNICAVLGAIHKTTGKDTVLLTSKHYIFLWLSNSPILSACLTVLNFDLLPPIILPQPPGYRKSSGHP